MRAYELEESAVDELKNRLPKLKVHSYDTIDRLLNHVSARHKITGKKLHDMFVSKYGHTPDTWVKKITNKLAEEGVAEEWSQKYKKSINCSHPKGFSQKAHCAGKKKSNEGKELSEITKKSAVKQYTDIQNYKPNFKTNPKSDKEEFFRITLDNLNKKVNKVNEGVEGPEDVEKVKHFIKWSYKTLNMQKPYPRITLSKDTKKAQAGHHTGLHVGNDIWVYVANRNMIDIFRTIFHELTHHRQMQLNMIKDGDSYPGSPIEMLADMAAGKFIKIYGKDHPEMFQ